MIEKPSAVQWLSLALSPTGRLYLEAHQVTWHKVGRVCFHLAENKTDSLHAASSYAIIMDN